MTSERNIKIVKNCLGIWIIPEICYSLSYTNSQSDIIPTRPNGRVIYGFSCQQAREAVFIVYYICLTI